MGGENIALETINNFNSLRDNEGNDPKLISVVDGMLYQVMTTFQQKISDKSIEFLYKVGSYRLARVKKGEIKKSWRFKRKTGYRRNSGRYE